VLILRDVLHWQAREVAELLETSEISVQSALQRARGTLAEEQARVSGQARSSQLQDHGLLDRYVDAFSRWDVDQLISLLHEDATQTMPPHALTPVDLAELHKRDVTFACIARAPLEAIERYKRELGFTFLWYSSHGSDFNYDFHVTLDASKTPIEYNYMSHEQLLAAGYPNEILKGDWPANSVFLREGDQVFHTYTAFARGLDQNAPTYAFLDLTVYGRQEPWEDSPAGWPQPMRRPPE
jgi:hypothetical protein